ncbi:MAG: hypothetical protein FJ403_02810 [Verrucomicrobia bacterium]|nr:hypothetical protein [Verrucomicrobiota bacterium]
MLRKSSPCLPQAPQPLAIGAAPNAENLLVAQAEAGGAGFEFGTAQYAPLLLEDGSGRFQVDVLGGTVRPRTFMIRFADIDPKTVSAIEEDLSVMSRIIAKTVKEKDDDAVTAMGMKIRSLPASGAQNLYLDGYGALLLFNVRFPLVEPAEAPEKETAKDAPDSTWEQAKRELYGPRELPASARVWTSHQAREEFDATKVTKLKESILKALKDGTNIRNLKPNEFITVVVSGPDYGVTRRVSRIVRSGKDDSTPNLPAINAYALASPNRWAVAAPGGGNSVMTLRAKKSDTDAFAKGSLTFDEFQKKVSIANY